jgi:hypothetical protein
VGYKVQEKLHPEASENKKVGPGVYLASNRNEYQKHKNNNISGE